jgi:CRISPR-associated endonuclease/helicase Cas3
MPAIAHSRNDAGVRHVLTDHLTAVAALAAEFAAPLAAAELAYALGLWHDLGKFHPDFQQYLRDVEQPGNRRRHGPDHKAAGVRLAIENGLQAAALPLQGHHGSALQAWYGRTQPATDLALGEARAALAIDLPRPTIPNFVGQDARAAEFFLRLLFSALVDADFLDTEAHFQPDKTALRPAPVPLQALWARFAADQAARFAAAEDTAVNRARAAIYEACLAAAPLPPGLFRLTVPTGGGKTRSGLAFALRHALAHGQRRVIVAVPYITITQQTAGAYRAIFEGSEDGRSLAPLERTGDATELIVLEHHSGTAETASEADEYDPTAVRARLAAENWDAPLIVTTTVQLFESMFANSTSRCRKLHRLANSVIILDEAQSLPPRLLEPILDGLRELCAHYNTTVVLSTATQPAFEVIEPFRALEAREIVPDPARYFRALKRVRYEWRVAEPLSWEAVAALMREEAQALAICNTKQDALDLLDALDDPGALHLSTLLCGAHRTAVIAELRRRLAAGEPCRLVATQVVEAGVDIDFPLVLRALGPLDSIVQAAGRANREGRLAEGRVIVFEPQNGRLPPGPYKRAAQTARTLLNSGLLDLHDPATMARYFTLLYDLEDTDERSIQKARAALDYPAVAERFRLIDDQTISVVITTYGSAAERARVRALLERLRYAPPTRALLRALQPYTVSVWARQAGGYMARGLLSPPTAEGLAPGLWEWLGGYDPVRGLVSDALTADQLVF